MTKEGYEEARSAWLPANPPKTDIAVGMVSYEAPVLTAASVHEDRITLAFSKYLDPRTLDGISVKDSAGETVNSAVSYDESQVSAEGECFADELSLTFDNTAALPGDTFTVLIPDTVRSYAGTAAVPAEKRLTYTGEKRIAAPEALSVPCAASAADEYTFYVTLENAAPGDRLTASSDSDGIVSVVRVGAPDESGEAAVTLRAGLAGKASLTVALAGEDLRVVIPVTVDEEIIEGEGGLSLAFGGFALTTEGREADCTLKNTGSAVRVKLIAAVYDGGRMTDIKIEELTLRRNEVLHRRFILGPGTVRIMVWRTDTLAPALDGILTLR